MKTLNEFIHEAQEVKEVKETKEQDNVYVVYFNDGTMDNYFESKDDAEARKEELNKEMPDNKCEVKEEPRSNFEAKV